jgi:putative transposase
VELIQALILLGLEAVNDLLQQEVTALAGSRYQRSDGVPGRARWGSQAGSLYLADQKVAVDPRRVRNVRRGQEVPPSTYQQLRQGPWASPTSGADCSASKTVGDSVEYYV